MNRSPPEFRMGDARMAEPEAGSGFLESRQAEAIVRLVEAAPQVRRRYQFFVWSQSHLQPLLPHQVLICGAYQRARRGLAFEAFHSVVLPPELLRMLGDGEGPLMRALMAAWIEGRGRPLLLEPASLSLAAPGVLLADELAALLREKAFARVLLHGVSRPQRPAEIESLFLVAGMQGDLVQAQRHVELLLPHLHSTWQRVVSVESETGVPPPVVPVPPRRPEPQPRQLITERERQILMWVRDGKSNHQIGAVLGISPLTVKNHIQKILRKLGASNRAQAVAQAMSQQLLDAPARRP